MNVIIKRTTFAAGALVEQSKEPVSLPIKLPANSSSLGKAVQIQKPAKRQKKVNPYEFEIDLDRQVLGAFGEPVYLNGNAVSCVFESGIEITDEAGAVAVVDAVILSVDVAISLGDVIAVRDRNYTVNQFLTREGTLNRYQVV